MNLAKTAVALAGAVILIFACMASYPHAASAAEEPSNTHPFRGYVRVCTSQGTSTPACEYFQSNQLFDVQAECEAEMLRRGQALGLRIHNDMPQLNVNVSYVCRPDPNAYDA